MQSTSRREKKEDGSRETKPQWRETTGKQNTQQQQGLGQAAEGKIRNKIFSHFFPIFFLKPFSSIPLRDYHFDLCMRLSMARHTASSHGDTSILIQTQPTTIHEVAHIFVGTAGPFWMAHPLCVWHCTQDNGRTRCRRGRPHSRR